MPLNYLSCDLASNYCCLPYGGLFNTNKVLICLPWIRRGLCPFLNDVSLRLCHRSPLLMKNVPSALDFLPVLNANLQVRGRAGPMVLNPFFQPSTPPGKAFWVEKKVVIRSISHIIYNIYNSVYELTLKTNNRHISNETILHQDI